MRLIGKQKLEKLKRKNKGNALLKKGIDQLIDDIENNNWESPIELKKTRKDADCVHPDGFYFFDISVHWTMIMIEFDDDGEATVIWVGNHQDYELIFKNNKNVIKKWLNSNDYI